MKIYDISQEVFSGQVYPGDTPPSAFPVLRMSEGAVYNLTDIAMCVHNATHIDAPFHFIRDGADIGSLPLEIFIGRTLVAEASRAAVSGGEMARILADSPERILLKGGGYLTEEAALAVVSAGIRLIGTESQSIGCPGAPAAVHRILLGAGIPILEGLVLAGIEPAVYFLCALPLKLAGLDGSPCRAVLISEKN